MESLPRVSAHGNAKQLPPKTQMRDTSCQSSSRKRPSVSDPGPIRSDGATANTWRDDGASLPLLPHTNTHWGPASSCCTVSLPSPPTSFHTSSCPPPSSPLSFLFLNRCCLRYYLCYTNQINRRHFFSLSFFCFFRCATRWSNVLRENSVSFFKKTIFFRCVSFLP
ncbi:hypothetical protein OJAV_G00182550 [Oryzias javanicus]|uniref:Uncharacterized protein n=1 Tax=Oryzias javanicus TaxID=123683 RepID=A0A3S2NVX7_ORYJA|nr:hypothetical protein OJAV_G00182550 [Oryzias javanicus]